MCVWASSISKSYAALHLQLRPGTLVADIRLLECAAERMITSVVCVESCRVIPWNWATERVRIPINTRVFRGKAPPENDYRETMASSARLSYVGHWNGALLLLVDEPSLFPTVGFCLSRIPAGVPANGRDFCWRTMLLDVRDDGSSFPRLKTTRTSRAAFPQLQREPPCFVILPSFPCNLVF